MNPNDREYKFKDCWNVLNIATFGTEGPRAACLDACRGYRSEEYPDGIDYDNIRGSLSLSTNTKKQIYFQSLSKNFDYIYDSDLHLILSIGSDKVAEKKLANFTYSQMEQKNGIILAGDFFSVPVGDKEQTLVSYGLTIHDISYKYIYY